MVEILLGILVALTFIGSVTFVLAKMANSFAGTLTPTEQVKFYQDFSFHLSTG